MLHHGLAPICGICRKRLPIHEKPEHSVALSVMRPDLASKIQWLFAVSAVTFIIGIFSPLMTVSKHVTKFWIEFVNERNTVSLTSGLNSLVQEGHYAMFLLLFLFSIVFPVTKLVLCFLMWGIPLSFLMRKRISILLHHAGKWSMLDVFVVGVLVVAVKLGDMVDVDLHAGVFWFAASVCFSIWLKSVISKVQDREFGGVEH